MKDFDPWYNEIKSIEKLNPVVKSPSALDTISFHYVSQNESTLLYQMLSTQCLLKGQNIDSRALHQLWPSAPQHIGHYSRKIKNEYEANLTYIHLCHRLTVMLCD